MFAIVDIAGQQFKVEKDQKLYVHRLDGEAGSNVFLGKVLLIDNDKTVIVGNPVISDAAISVKILSHLKGDKVKIFKKKRRKAYQILKSHRQLLTEIQVSEILEKGGSKAIKETSAKKTVKETVPEETLSQKETAKKPEKKVAVKSEKATDKASGITETTKEKKASKSKTKTGKPSDSEKSNTPSPAKAPKSKPGTTKKASLKKTDKPPKK